MESQNHGINWIARALKVHPVPPPVMEVQQLCILKAKKKKKNFHLTKTGQSDTCCTSSSYEPPVRRWNGVDVVTDAETSSTWNTSCFEGFAPESQSRLLCEGSGEEISVLTFPPSVLHTSPASVFKAVFFERRVDAFMVKSNFLI